MKRAVIFIFTLSLVISACVITDTVFKKGNPISSSYNSNVNLVIDAGHGGIDVGTIGVNGENEKEINLNIAKKLYEFTSITGITAYLVRDGDYLVYKDSDSRKRSDLYNRLDYVNSIHNSVLISIHQNHFENEAEWGTQIWYSPNDDESKVLADSILTIVKDNLQKNNRRENKKSDNSYYLLYKAKVPSVMVECGFMSNNEENSKLNDNSYQNQMAYSIMLGFLDYQAKEY